MVNIRRTLSFVHIRYLSKLSIAVVKCIYIRSFRSLSYDKAIASSKGSSAQSENNASSISFQYPLASLRSSRICLCLLPRLPVTSNPSYNSPSITCFRRLFTRKMWPNQLAFLHVTVRRILISHLTLGNTSYFTRSVQMSFSTLIQQHISKLSRYI